MLRSQNLSVLIVDDDAARATHVAHLVRMLGSVPTIAATLDQAAARTHEVDFLLIDDDAFDRRGAALAAAASREAPHVYRCLTAGWARVAHGRPLVDSVIAKPFTAAALGDVLAAASDRKLRREGAAPSPSTVIASAIAAHRSRGDVVRA